MHETKFEKRVEDAAQQAGGLLRSKYGLWALGGISFAESALPVPLITDPFMSAYILADRSNVWRGLVVTVATSVMGGVFAFALAFTFYEFLVQQYLTGSLADEFFKIADEFNKGTLVITLLGAVTPVPYTIVALAAGFMKANLAVFIVASIIGRTFRYSIVAWLTYQYGQQALEIARQHLTWVTIACFLLAALYYFLIH